MTSNFSFRHSHNSRNAYSGFLSRFLLLLHSPTRATRSNSTSWKDYRFNNRWRHCRTHSDLKQFYSIKIIDLLALTSTNETNHRTSIQPLAYHQPSYALTQTSKINLFSFSLNLLLPNLTSIFGLCLEKLQLVLDLLGPHSNFPF